MVDLQMDAEFIGKNALKKIREAGISQKQVGLEISGPPLNNPNTEFWNLSRGSQSAGKITSAVYSPRLNKNIALGMVHIDYSKIDTILEAQIGKQRRLVKIAPKPFYDPRKAIAVK